MNIVQRFLVSNATNQPLGETGELPTLDTPWKALAAGLIGGAVLLTIAGAWHK